MSLIFDPIVGRLLVCVAVAMAHCKDTLCSDLTAEHVRDALLSQPCAHVFVYLDAASRGQRNSESVGAHSQPNGPADG